MRSFCVKKEREREKILRQKEKRRSGGDADRRIHATFHFTFT